MPGRRHSAGNIPPDWTNQPVSFEDYHRSINSYAGYRLHAGRLFLATKLKQFLCLPLQSLVFLLFFSSLLDKQKSWMANPKDRNDSVVVRVQTLLCSVNRVWCSRKIYCFLLLMT